MGLDLTYSSGDAKFTHRFSNVDWQTIEALRAHVGRAVEVCFDVPEFGEPVRVATAALKEGALTMERFLGENAHLLPATYQFTVGRFMLGGTLPGEFHTGGMSGLRMPNDPDHVYTILAGLNELALEKMAVGKDGLGVVVELRDLRGETELLTENAGTLRFRRRASKTTLRRALRDIAAFADGVTAGELMKTVG